MAWLFLGWLRLHSKHKKIPEKLKKLLWTSWFLNHKWMLKKGWQPCYIWRTFRHKYATILHPKIKCLQFCNSKHFCIGIWLGSSRIKRILALCKCHYCKFHYCEFSKHSRNIWLPVFPHIVSSLEWFPLLE